MAAADFYLKIDGIDGESTDALHKNEIELDSFSWSGHQTHGTGPGSGMATGKVQIGTLDCQAKMAKETPKLFAALCDGKHIAKAVLTARKSGGDGRNQDYAKWTLGEVAVSTLSLGAGAGSIPSVSFGLAFGKIEWEYKAQDAKGAMAVASTAGWDFKQNQKV